MNRLLRAVPGCVVWRWLINLTMIEEREINNLNILTGRQLDEFCMYWNSGPGRDEEKLRAGAARLENEPDFHKGLYQSFRLSNGWTFCDHKYIHRCILLDEKDTARLKGNSLEIAGLLLNMAITEQTLSHIQEKEYGLVLSGGGAKGAFEIGVWRWLWKTGLIHKITGISGTSVGALNSILFACSTLPEAEEIWLSLRQDDLTYVTGESLRRGAETLMRLMAGATAWSVNAVMMAKEMAVLSGGSVFTQEKLSEIVNRVLERKMPTDRIVFSCLARQSLQTQVDPPAESGIGQFHNADYYCLNHRDDRDIERIVMASAALPFVYDPININHFMYRDGGCRDNAPYMPLVKSGFKKLIVVHLSERKVNQKTIETAGNTLLYHVYPTIRIRKVIDTIRISKEMTEDWINNGEQAAAAQLGPYFRNGDLIDPEYMKYLSSRENKMDKFDYENFNFDDAFRSVQSEIKKPNILICGATGVGKSTLIRDLFRMGEAEGPEIGKQGRSKTTGIHAYSPEGAGITLYDSQGYNIGADENKFMKDILGVIERKVRENPEDMSGHIHEVWYCVSAANNRFFGADEKMIHEIQKKYSIPVMVILTKVDCADEEGISCLKKAISEKIPGIPIFTYACDEKTADWDEEIKKRYVQKEEITEWALMHLDESLRAGFIPSIKKSLQMKRRFISGKVIPKYAALAAGTVVATSFISVPFTDSVPLMAMQVKMAYEIINGYGIHADKQQMVANLLGTSAVSALGRTLATSLVKVIPVAGNVINATVNSTVAASITATLGFAIAIVCEQYLAACVDNNGAENLPFAQYMNSERLKEVFKYVNAHRNEFNIKEITKIAVKNSRTPEE